jgi:PAS domain S-box-containing protein
MSVFLRDLSLRESLVAKVPKLVQVVRFQHLLALWTAGAAALAFATWVCLRLGLSSETTICVHLIIIVLLSLMDSIASSIIFSIIAVGCLDYFFIKPLYSFSVASAEDLTAIAAFLVASIVITSLVRRLQQLGQAHREQAQLLDLTSDSIQVLDSENVITYWNRGSEDLYGWKRQEALGKVSHQLLQTKFPDSLEQIKEIVLRIGHWEGELIRTGRDGRQIIAASRWSLQRDEDGRALGILETNNDITERRRAEDALRRIQETYLAEAQQIWHGAWQIVQRRSDGTSILDIAC